jgi:hypothetical protein
MAMLSSVRYSSRSRSDGSPPGMAYSTRPDAVSRRPAAQIAGHRQGSGSDYAAGFRAARRDSPGPVAAIGEPAGWRIPRLATAHYLIS